MDKKNNCSQLCLAFGIHNQNKITITAYLITELQQNIEIKVNYQFYRKNLFDLIM